MFKCVSLLWLQVCRDIFLLCSGGKKLGGEEPQCHLKQNGDEFAWYIKPHIYMFSMKGGETVTPQGQMRKAKSCRLWGVPPAGCGAVSSRRAMKMLTVLISEAAGVKCLAGGVDGSKQFEHRVCKCLLKLGKLSELSEPLKHSHLQGLCEQRQAFRA